MNWRGKEIQLAILDMDGTLIDSTGIWEEIDRKFFASYGMDVPPDYVKHIAHVGLAEAARFTRNAYLPDVPEEEIMAAWHDLSIQAYEEEIPAKEGAYELLDYLKGQGVTLCLATANSPELYLPALHRLGMKEYFDSFIDPNLCERGKEGGAMFLFAAGRYDVPIEATLVLEDSLHPLKAAFDLGFLALGVYDVHSCKDEEEHRRNCFYFGKDLRQVLAYLKAQVR